MVLVARSIPVGGKTVPNPLIGQNSSKRCGRAQQFQMLWAGTAVWRPWTGTKVPNARMLWFVYYSCWQLWLSVRQRAGSSSVSDCRGTWGRRCMINVLGSKYYYDFLLFCLSSCRQYPSMKWWVTCWGVGSAGSSFSLYRYHLTTYLRRGPESIYRKILLTI